MTRKLNNTTTINITGASDQYQNVAINTTSVTMTIYGSSKVKTQVYRKSGIRMLFDQSILQIIASINGTEYEILPNRDLISYGNEINLTIKFRIEKYMTITIKNTSIIVRDMTQYVRACPNIPPEIVCRSFGDTYYFYEYCVMNNLTNELIQKYGKMIIRDNNIITTIINLIKSYPQCYSRDLFNGCLCGLNSG